jgi:membrane-associated phospholipid phosphatase
MGGWLESLVPWGTEVIVWVQSFSNAWLDAIALFFTQLGYEEFYLVVLPFIYWCVHRQTGIALGFLSMLSTWLNSVIKFIFRIPRPADPRIHVLRADAVPYSFSSGHAQNAVVNWGYLAYRFRNRVFWVVAVVVILCIALSRLVVGVHYPQDIVAGLLTGIVLLALYAWAAPAVGRWLGGQGRGLQLVLAVVVPLLLIFAHPADSQGHYPASDAIRSMAALIGLGLGIVMERASVRFRVDGPWWRRGLRFAVGMIVVALFYLGPRLILPEDMAYGPEAAVRFVRYALVGWATAFLAPWLFVRLRLAEQE